MENEWEVITNHGNWLLDANTHQWMFTTAKLSLPGKSDYWMDATHCLLGERWKDWLTIHHFNLILEMNGFNNQYRSNS